MIWLLFGRLTFKGLVKRLILGYLFLFHILPYCSSIAARKYNPVTIVKERTGYVESKSITDYIIEDFYSLFNQEGGQEWKR